MRGNRNQVLSLGQSRRTKLIELSLEKTKKRLEMTIGRFDER